MKTRVLTASIAVPVLALIIFLAPVWILALVIGAVAACCSLEYLRCTEPDCPGRFRICTAVCAFLLPVSNLFLDGAYSCEAVLLLLTLYLFAELMLSFRRERHLTPHLLGSALLSGGVLPFLLSAIVRLGLRGFRGAYAALPFLIAFTCDAGAFFAGTLLGKHPLAPQLSPKKTIEGSIGGFLSAVLASLIYGMILILAGLEVRLGVLTVYGFLGALACQLGDLAFSSVKRLAGVKDYGDLIPGHGGMLDRFDSMFWTAALVELLAAWVPAIL